MKRRGYTIFLLPDRAERARQMRFPRAVAVVAILSVVSFVVFAAAVLLDDITARRELQQMQYLKAANNKQRAQLKDFALKIEDIELVLARIQVVDRNLRSLTDLDKEPPENTPEDFGLGGPLEEDLESIPTLSAREIRLIKKMHSDIRKLNVGAMNQEESLLELSEYFDEKIELMKWIPSSLPVDGWISSGFGFRRSPFTGRRQFHDGLDIVASPGAPVVAPAGGRVAFVGRKGSFGKMIVLDHGHGLRTLYSHCSKIFVSRGERVKRGGRLASVGNTGRSTGAHVHYEVHLNGKPVNPKHYVFD